MQKVVTVPLIVTGGFRTKAAMEYALQSGAADLIGIGRPLCVTTDAPQQLLNGTSDSLPKYENDLDLIPAWLSFLKRFQMVKVVTAFASIFWFYEQFESIGQRGQALERLHPFTALTATEKRSQLILAQRTGVSVDSVLHPQELECSYQHPLRQSVSRYRISRSIH